MYALGLILLFITTVNVVLGGIRGGSGLTCNQWQTVVNISIPNGSTGEEIEPPPTQADIDHAKSSYCPPADGILRMRCVYDDYGYDLGFYGVVVTDDFESHCSLSNGSFCTVLSEFTCPDHRIEFICDCYSSTAQISEERQQTCSNIIADQPTGSSTPTSIVAQSSQNADRCPQNGRQNQNTASNIRMCHFIFFICVILSVLF